MSKFNLKNYVKVNGDEHIDRRLQEQHEAPQNIITERQLDDGRVEQKDVIMEKLLENKRIGSADVILEKNLNDSKGLFAPLRNSDTYNGNINKIEEQRLAGERAEKEKYEQASKTPKSDKWWEHLASNAKKIVTAAPKSKNLTRQVLEDDRMDNFTPEKGFGLAEEMGVGDEANEGLVPDKSNMGNEFIGQAEPQDVETEEETIKGMELIKNKVSEKPWPHMQFQVMFDPAEYQGDEDAIKEDALEKVLTANPNLEGKISVENFNPPIYKGTQSLMTMVLVGPEYFKKNQEETESSLFTNFQSEESDIGGTPITLGRIQLSPEAVTMAEENRGELTELLTDYIVEQDPDLKDVNLANYLNFSAIGKGEVTFVLGAPETEASPEPEEADEFPIADYSKIPEDDFPIQEFDEENTEASSSHQIKTAGIFEDKKQRDLKKNK